MSNQTSHKIPYSTKKEEYTSLEYANNEDEEAISNWLTQEFVINEWLDREEALLESSDIIVTQQTQPLPYVDQVYKYKKKRKVLEVVYIKLCFIRI
jgi:hypothetical protein